MLNYLEKFNNSILLKQNNYGHGPYNKTLGSSLLSPSDNSKGFDTDVTQVNWKAKWIWKPGGILINDFSYFRKIIDLAKPISSCKVYISAHNHYQLFINGQKVGGYVTPSPSHPVKSKLYLTYDITTLLVEDRNSFCAVVHYLGGDGQNYVNGKPGLLLQCEIVYKDATSDVFITDTTWKCTGITPYESQAPFQQNRRISAVESYNACLELEGWMDVEYIDELWYNSVLSEICSEEWILKPQMIPEGSVEEAIIPKLCGVQQLETQVFDAGKIVTGWPRIRLEGIKGVKIRLRYSEDLDENGRVRHNVANETSEFYYDEYLMKGVGIEVWEPSFSYKAFRYVEITGFPRMLGTEEITIICAHTCLDYKGFFRCSEEILNEIYKACISTQKNNVTGQMVDCPHREQAQYLADSDLQAETFGYNFLNPSVLEKVLSDFHDAQENDGTFPFVFPSNYEHPDFRIKIPEWDLHYCTLLWKIYNLYGDKGILQRYYPTAKRMVDYYLSTIDTATGLIPKSKDWHISDWPYPNIDQSGKFLTIQNCKFYNVLNIMIKIAAIESVDVDLKRYSKETCKMKDSIVLHLYDLQEKKFRDSMNSNIYSQGTNVVACRYGLVPDEDLVFLIEYIANQQLNCSTLITMDLLRLLFDHGKQEVAMNMLMSEEYPSWGYMMKKGYQTVWEGFQNIESHCHAWNAYPARILAEYLVGIRLISPGFENVEIRPFMSEMLEFAEAKVPTIRGIIHVWWQRIGKLRKIFVDIPQSVCSIVVISNANEISKVEESGNTLWVNGKINSVLGKIEEASLKENEIVFELKCGCYTFIICD